MLIKKRAEIVTLTQVGIASKPISLPMRVIQHRDLLSTVPW